MADPKADERYGMRGSLRRHAAKVRLRTRLAREQGWRCCWCGGRMVREQGRPDSVTLEHVVPRRVGGTITAAACAACNSARGAADGVAGVATNGDWPDEARVTLAAVWPCGGDPSDAR